MHCSALQLGVLQCGAVDFARKIDIYIYIYIYVCVCVCVCVHMRRTICAHAQHWGVCTCGAVWCTALCYDVMHCRILQCVASQSFAVNFARERPCTYAAPTGTRSQLYRHCMPKNGEIALLQDIGTTPLKNRALLITFRALLIKFRALWIKCMEKSHSCPKLVQHRLKIGLFASNIVPFWSNNGLFWLYRALLITCMAFWIKYRALLIKCREKSHSCPKLAQHRFKIRAKQRTNHKIRQNVLALVKCPTHRLIWNYVWFTLVYQ